MATRRRRHAATRRTIDRSTIDGHRRPEHEPVPPAKEPPPIERDEVRELLAKFKAERGWDSEPSTSGTATSPPPPALSAEDVARRRAVLDEQLAALRAQEISKLCDHGEHEKCATCGCRCHARPA